MKLIKLSPLILCLAIIVACSTTKKSKNSAPATATSNPPEATNTTTTASTAPKTKPLNGIYEPGEEEVNAIRMQYMSITLETLKEGHSLYIGTCTNCHKANNIYRYSESDWKSIIVDMSARAQLSTTQQDAVYKYVLSIKAAKL